MRTTPGTATLTRRSRAGAVLSGAAVLILALPLTGALGGVAVADTDAAAERGHAATTHAADHGKPAGPPGQTEPTPAADADPVIGPVAQVAPVIGPVVQAAAVPTPSATASMSPQPLSSADLNGTGANDPSATNPYASTRDGSPSLNGNGSGQQAGQPCAGCVGKADNKNPPGQAPNGTDANAGYECDRNSGVGRTNPAHTGCPPTSSPTPSPSPSRSVAGCPPGTSMVNGSCTSPPTVTVCPPGSVSTAAGCVSAPSGGTTTPVTGRGTTPVVPVGPVVPQGSPEAPGALPFTGANTRPLLGLGAALLLVGGALMVTGGRSGRRELTAAGA